MPERGRDRPPALRRPPEAACCRLSRCCSACVTSKITGKSLQAFFITPKPSMSTTRLS
jgi:hypothetical protein